MSTFLVAAVGRRVHHALRDARSDHIVQWPLLPVLDRNHLPAGLDYRRRHGPGRPSRRPRRFLTQRDAGPPKAVVPVVCTPCTRQIPSDEGDGRGLPGLASYSIARSYSRLRNGWRALVCPHELGGVPRASGPLASAPSRRRCPDRGRKEVHRGRRPRPRVQMAYWGFFSAFSLLLAFVSILGFAFQGISSNTTSEPRDAPRSRPGRCPRRSSRSRAQPAPRPPTPKLPERPTKMRVTNAVPIRCGRLGRGAIVGRLTAAPASGVTRRRPGCVFEATVEAAGCRAGSVLGAAPRRPQREVDDRFVQRHVPVSRRHRSRRTWRLSSHCLPPRPCEGSTLSTSSFAKARSWTRVHSSASIDLRVSSANANG